MERLRVTEELNLQLPTPPRVPYPHSVASLPLFIRCPILHVASGVSINAAPRLSGVVRPHGGVFLLICRWFQQEARPRSMPPVWVYMYRWVRGEETHEGLPGEQVRL